MRRGCPGISVKKRKSTYVVTVRGRDVVCVCEVIVTSWKKFLRLMKVEFQVSLTSRVFKDEFSLPYSNVPSKEGDGEGTHQANSGEEI